MEGPEWYFEDQDHGYTHLETYCVIKIFTPYRDEDPVQVRLMASCGS
jgi:hypothetical protein